MKLQIGKVSTQELAEFFEISYSYLRRTSVKEKYMTILKQFADYEEVYGGVFIKQVKCEEYIPPQLPLRELFERELKKLPESEYFEGHVYGTLLQIAEDTLEEVNNLQKNLGLRVWKSAKTLANKYGMISKELYGEMKFNQRLYERGGFYSPEQIVYGRGPLGVRLSCMLIKTHMGYRELTKEEKDLFRQISDEYDDERQELIKEEMFALREAAYIHQTEQDADSRQVLSAMEEKLAKDFSVIRQRFVERTNLTLVSRGTAWKDEECPKFAFPVREK